jgi:hypothetical protein
LERGQKASRNWERQEDGVCHSLVYLTPYLSPVRSNSDLSPLLYNNKFLLF